MNKTRMLKGLSPEEFKELSTAAVNDIIKDQQLIDLVRNTNQTYKRDSNILDIIKIIYQKEY